MWMKPSYSRMVEPRSLSVDVSGRCSSRNSIKKTEKGQIESNQLSRIILYVIRKRCVSLFRIAVIYCHFRYVGMRCILHRFRMFRVAVRLRTAPGLRHIPCRYFHIRYASCRFSFDCVKTEMMLKVYNSWSSFLHLSNQLLYAQLRHVSPNFRLFYDHGNCII